MAYSYFWCSLKTFINSQYDCNTYFQVERVDMEMSKTCTYDCSHMTGQKNEKCPAEYKCYQVRGVIMQWHSVREVRSHLVTTRSRHSSPTYASLLVEKIPFPWTFALILSDFLTSVRNVHPKPSLSDLSNSVCNIVIVVVVLPDNHWKYLHWVKWFIQVSLQNAAIAGPQRLS